jgi:hypothetical protein
MKEAFGIVIVEKDLQGRRGRHEKVFRIVFCNWVIFGAPQQLGLLANKKLHVENMFQSV